MKFTKNSLYGKVLIITILLWLFLVSCVHHERYPSEWGPLISIKENECFDISGKYVNLGDKAEDKNANVRLAEIPGFRNHPLEATHFQIIKVDSDGIEISSWKEHELLYWDVYTFKCKKEGLEIKLSGGKDFVSLGGVVWPSQYLYLSKSIDGALIIKLKETVYGVILLIPSYGSADILYRFGVFEEK